MVGLEWGTDIPATMEWWWLDSGETQELCFNEANESTFRDSTEEQSSIRSEQA